MMPAFCQPCRLQFRRTVHCGVIEKSFKRKMCLSHYVIGKNFLNNKKEVMSLQLRRRALLNPMVSVIKSYHESAFFNDKLFFVLYFPEFVNFIVF